MVSNVHNLAQARNSPFNRNASVSPGPGGHGGAAGRPKSVNFGIGSPLSTMSTPVTGHARTQSHTSIGGSLAPSGSVPRHRRDKSREGTPISGTFAPSFIKTDDMRRKSVDAVHGIEGENDFSGKRYVWLKDPQAAFVKGWIIEDLGGNRIVVQCDDGTVSII